MSDPRDDDSECPSCGGEGWTFECFDGCCADADTGCDDCLRECDCQKRQASPELQKVLREALAKGQSMDEAAADNFGLTADDLDEDEAPPSPIASAGAVDD